MAPPVDPHTLNAQLQRILDSANETFSTDQAQLLTSETEQSMGDPVAGLGCGNPRKRKANRCDGTNCGPPPSSRKPRMQAPEGEVPAELLAGRFRCEACSQWIVLRDETGFTLAHWVSHLLVCGQSKQALLSAISATADTNKESTPQGESSGQGSTSSAVIPMPAAIFESVPLSSLRNDARSQSGMVSQPSRRTQGPSSNILPAMPAEAERSPVSPRISAKGHPPDVSSTPHTSAVATKSARDSIDVNFQPTVTSPLSSQGITPRQRRPNRTETERIEEFRNDPQVAEVEPYRVLCAICDKWIKLRMNSRYCSIPWNCHKGSCSKSNGPVTSVRNTKSVRQESASSSQHGGLHTRPDDFVSGPAPEQSTVTNPSRSQFSRSLTTPSSPLSSTYPSLPTHTATSPPPVGTVLLVAGNGLAAPRTVTKSPRRARLADADERRAVLEADPHTEVVEPDRILCALCKKWVKLRPNSSYCSAPWRSHIQRCIPRRRRKSTLDIDPALGPTDPSTRGSVTVLSSTASEGVPNLDPDRPRGNYYRKNYENPLDPRFNEEQIRASYYKASAPPEGPATSEVPLLPLPKRRGRPPKNKAPKVKLDRLAHKSDSEMSFESEEE